MRITYKLMESSTLNLTTFICILFLSIPCLATCCLNCASYSGSNCGVCNTNYYLYNSLICVNSCPAGYTASSGICSLSSSLVLIDIDFSQYSIWTVSTVGALTTPTGSTLVSSSTTNLIPTLYQGFYIQSSSYMIGTSNWVPSPDLTISMWVLILSDGDLFDVSTSSTSNIEVYISLSVYILQVYLLSQLLGLSVLNLYSGVITTSAWELMVFSVRQTSSSMVTLKIGQNGSTSSTSLSGYEARYSSPYDWSLGSPFGSSMKGYVYHVRAYNGVDSTVLASVSPPSCAFNYYWDGSSCHQCGSGCATWPWCISGSTCSPCYNSNCAYCDGFAADQCFCADGEVYPSCCQIGCAACSSFWVCTTCSTGYYNLASICLGYCASGSCTSLTASALIDVVFNTFLGSYAGFVTGANANTYYPFNNPDPDDPMPIYNRGLYFTSATSLNNPSELLAYTFTIGVWALPTSGNIFSKGSGLVLGSNGSFTIQVFGKTGVASSITTSSATISTWSFITITSEFITGTTSITTTINNSQTFYSTYLNQIFEDTNPSTIVIGSSYTGFVYGFKLWNSAVYSFSNEVNNEICGTSSGFTCLLTCSYNDYYSNSCQPCLGSCTSGCVRSTSCDVCNSDLCLTCTSFGDTCTSCVSSTTLGSGICCQLGCSSCSSFWVCNTCNSGYYNLAGICLNYCASGSCTSLTTSPLIDILFNTFLGTYSGFVTGANANTYYPFNNPDSDDPMPIENRGLYFTPATSLNNPSILLAYTFTIGVWVLPTSGTIFSKGSEVSLGSDGTVVIQILDETQISSSVSSLSTSISGWSFITITVEFTTDTTSITTAINNSQYFSSTNLNQIFEDLAQSTFTIGNSYTGFVYGIKLWNSALYSFSSEVNDKVCGTASGFTCLYTCSYNEYYSSSCQPCLGSCTSGCVRSSSCDVCADDLCLLCTSFTSACSACPSQTTLVSGICCQLGCTSCSTFWVCNACIVGYYSLDNICLDYCSSGSCTSLTTSALIDVVFDTFLGIYSGFITGADSNTYYPFNNPDSDDPIPIYDRGLYFTTATSLNNPSMLLAYTFTIGIWALPTSGNIFSKGSGLVLSSDGSFTIQILDRTGVGSSITTTSTSISAWSFIAITCEFITDSISITATINNSQTFYSTYLNQIFEDTNPSTIIIGDSYTGFVYGYKLWNSAVYSFTTEVNDEICGAASGFTCLLTCSYLEYFSASCTACDASCVSGCVRSTSCDVCNSDLCLTCTSFGNTCTSCVSTSTLGSGICCQLGCSSCSSFWMCNSCNSGYYNLAGICLNYCASGSCTSLTTAALIDEVFDTFLGSYSGFVTGANANTYHPFNSPDTDDPMPIDNRGLYFTPATSLNNPSVLLAYTFTIGVWTLPTSGNIFTKGSEVNLASDGTFAVQLLSETSVPSSSMSSSPGLSSWTFITITVEFITDTTSITTTINNSQYFSSTFLNQIFQDLSQSTLVLGNAYTGFIYGIKLWNTAVYSFTTEVDNKICGTGIGFSCLLTCSYDEYYTIACESCDSSCISGCVRNPSCDVCADDLCLLCTSFTSPCSSCPTQTSLSSGVCCQLGCLSCSTFWVCSSCDAGYYALNSICLDYCTSGSCTSLTAAALIDVVFDTFLGSYSGFVTGANANTYYPFNNPETDDPLPIEGRGLYFTPGTSLNNPGILLAYSFTIGIWVLPASGTIFTKGSEVSLDSSGVFTTQILSKTAVTSLITASPTPITGWGFIAITVEFLTDTTSITATINNSQYFYSTYLDQIFKDVSQSPIVIGNSYTGYVYGFKLWNSAVYSFSYEVNDEICGAAGGFACLIVCGYEEYYSSSCVSCLASCTLGCVRGTSCDVCQSDLCLICTSFGNTCTACVSGITLSNGVCCQLGCNSCSDYWVCDSCNVGYNNLGGICLDYCASGSCTSLTATALIDVHFDAFQGSYSGFVTGTSSSTYYPFNSPETDDPIPVFNRGLYFDIGTSLNNPSILLAYTFTAGIWALPSSGNIFTKGSEITLGSDGTFTLQILSETGVPSSILSSATPITGWSFIAITVEFITDTTSITASINNSQYFYFTYLDQIFQDASQSTLTIGNGYTGFVYGFKLWNSAVYSFNTEVNDEVCGVGNGFSCLLVCGYLEYYDVSCMPCDSSCEIGCVRSSSCDLCNSDLCLLCSYFTSPCTLCASNSILTSGTCVTCFTGCLTCTTTSYNTCNSCIEGYYMWDDSVCLNQCPTGFAEDSSCVFEASLALSVNLKELLLGNGDETTYGISSTNIYPDFDANDPWPAVDRGYYFSKGSYLSSAVIIAPTFSINIWVKILQYGLLLSKANILTLITSSPTTLQLSLVEGTVSTISFKIPVTSWCFLTISVNSLLSTIYLNKSQLTSISLPSLFEDPTALPLSISDPHGFFEGYVYSLEVYTQPDVFGTYLNTTCPLDSFCLSACDITQDPASSCTACPSSCTRGCFEGSCNLCTDQICYHCNFYDTCLSCRNNSSFRGSRCTCNDGYFWNGTSEACQTCEEHCTLCSATECLACDYMFFPAFTQCYPCPDKCVACDYPCTQCITNASPVDGLCRCNLNYDGGECTSVSLTVNASVTGGNITLQFSDQLSLGLSAASISVQIVGISLSWVVQDLGEAEYKILLTPSSEYSESNATLEFTREIISIHNAELVNKSIILTLSESTRYEAYKTLNTYSSTYSKATTYAISGLAAFASLLSNPTALWSFINTIQLLCFIPLSSVNLTPEIEGTLVGLRSYNIFPNMFTSFYKGGSTPDSTRAVRLGFVSNSVILNTGKEATAFLLFLGQYLVFYLLSFINCPIKFIDEYIMESLMEFKYGFFLRFAIQYYLEFCVACLLGLVSPSYTSADGLVNFALASGLSVNHM